MDFLNQANGYVYNHLQAIQVIAGATATVYAAVIFLLRSSLPLKVGAARV
ncbi:MAG TPA: hypothetical protein VJ302_00035 [Blastocatellia bacterium]|nr:hypothetical protein [Blastocatellia bacterium]